MRAYRPANGTEGLDFEARWCLRCERDRAWNEREEAPCAIHNRALMHCADEPGFPPEWVCEDDFSRPRCTAWVAEGEAAQPKPLPGQLSLLEVDDAIGAGDAP